MGWVGIKPGAVISEDGVGEYLWVVVAGMVQCLYYFKPCSHPDALSRAVLG